MIHSGRGSVRSFGGLYSKQRGATTAKKATYPILTVDRLFASDSVGLLYLNVEGHEIDIDLAGGTTRARASLFATAY